MRNISPSDIIESRQWADLIKRLNERLVEEWERTNPADLGELQHVSYRRQALAEIVQTIAREVRAPVNLPRGDK